MNKQKKVLDELTLTNNKLGKSRKKIDAEHLKTDSSKDEQKIRKKIFRKQFSKKDKIISSVVVFIFFILFLLFIYLIINRRFDNTNLIWRYYYSTNNFGSKSNVQYDLLNNNTIRLTHDGITEVSDDGQIRWTMSYNIKNPIYVKRGNYFAVSGISENVIYLFDENGIVSTANTDFPVVKIALSETGVIYALVDGGDASFIEVYNVKGERLDITIKSLLKENGTPIDIAISNDATELMVSFLYIDGNNVNTRVVFYNFDEVGKNKSANRIVGGFDSEYKGKYVSRVHFFNNEKSVCFYDGGLTFFSTRILTEPTVINNITFDDIIKSISYNENYVAIVLENENDNNLRFMVFDKEGKVLTNKRIDFLYDEFFLSDNYVVFIYNSHAYVFDNNGMEKLNRDFSEDLYFIGKKNKLLFTELVVGTSDYSDCVSAY